MDVEADMVGVSLAEALSAGLLLLVVGFAYALTTSKAEDPKFRLLDSLLSALDGEPARFHHRRAA
jgi:hypothetical protein